MHVPSKVLLPESQEGQAESAACATPLWGAVNHSLHLLTCHQRGHRPPPAQPVDLSTPIIPMDLLQSDGLSPAGLKLPPLLTTCRQRSRYVMALTHSLLASHFVPHLAPATTALRLM